MNKIGIDKISLTTKEFRLENLNLLGRKLNIAPNETNVLPMYTDLKGKQVEANSLYFNGGATYDISAKGLMVTFNPSKNLHPFNLTSTGKELNNQIKLVEKELKSIGIVTNIEDMKLSRFDLAKNQTMQHPQSMYHDGLKYLKGKRSESRQAPDGFYIGNKSHESLFYNKYKQLKYDKIEVIAPERLARFEARFRNTETVRRYTTISSLNELKSIENEDIDSMYKTYLNKVVFTRVNIGIQSLIDFESEAQLYQSLKSQYPKGYFNYYLNLNSAEYVLSKFGSMENFIRFLESVGENRMSIHRKVNKLKDLISTHSFLSSKKGKQVTPLTLLNEIKERFAA